MNGSKILDKSFLLLTLTPNPSPEGRGEKNPKKFRYSHSPLERGVGGEVESSAIFNIKFIQKLIFRFVNTVVLKACDLNGNYFLERV